MVQDQRQSGFSPRAFAVALALLCAIPIVGFYVELAWLKTYGFASGVPAVAPLAALFLLAALMSLPALRRSGLTRRELLVVYVVVLVGSPIYSHGILFWLLPKVAAFYYWGRAQPLWETTFVGYIPTWFAPVESSAAEGLFLGHSPVPWSLWWTPLAAWLSFLVCVFVAPTSVIILLHQQWIANERLTFPIAQIPLEAIREPAARGAPRAGRLPTEVVFWLGLGASLLVSLINGLSRRYPAVPAIPLGPVPLVQWQKVGPLAGLGEIDLVLTPWLIALSYLMPRELSFSCWFFWLARLGLTVAAIGAGHEPQRPEEWFESGFPAPYRQAAGAALVLGLWAIWIAKRHILAALRRAFRFRSPDRQDPLPVLYRLALLGLVLSSSWMVAFCWLAGCRLVFGLALVALIVNAYVVWARLRAETGLGFLYYPLEMGDAFVMPFGTTALRPREVVTLFSLRWAYYPFEGSGPDILTGHVLEGLKIADAAGIDRRRLLAAVTAGLLFSVVLGTWIVLSGLYHYGYVNLAYGLGQTWPAHQTRYDGTRIFEMLTTPRPPDIRGMVGIGTGAAVALGLGALRLRFWWWPFHPVGYLTAMGWGMQHWYMPFFIGWVAKSLAVRYGGLRLYRRTVPLAIGIILGDVLDQGIWALVALLTEGKV